MLDDVQLKLFQQRQKIKIFYGLPQTVAETVNLWVETTGVYIVSQEIKTLENNTIFVSILYVASSKPTSGQSLPPSKGQQLLPNLEAIKAAYEHT